MTADANTYLSLSAIGTPLGITKQAVHKAAIRNNLTKNAAGKFAFEDVAATCLRENKEKPAGYGA